MQPSVGKQCSVILAVIKCKTDRIFTAPADMSKFGHMKPRVSHHVFSATTQKETRQH